MKKTTQKNNEDGTMTTTLEVGGKKMKAKWTLEAAEDMRVLHGVDLEHELVNMMAKELGLERKYGSLYGKKDFELT